MAIRVEIVSKLTDTRAQVRKHKLHSAGFRSITEVWLVDVYTIDKKLAAAQLTQIGAMLANPVTQDVFFGKHFAPSNFSYALEIGFLPGVTDNSATTTREMIEDLLSITFTKDEGVYSSQVTFIAGSVKNHEIERIAQSLYNPLIQRGHVKSTSQFKKDKGMAVVVPKVLLSTKTRVDTVNLAVGDEDLIAIGSRGIANSDGTTRGPLALDLPYMKAIQNYFAGKNRNPTDIELESLAQTWSEHCKHTIFADPIDNVKDGLYKHFIKRATYEIGEMKRKKSHFAKASRDRDFCVSVFHDNSGAIKFDDEFLITHKVETHNSPSALDPFGGAITGIVGVNRDTLGFGLGAKPIANMYGFCFAPPSYDTVLFRDKNKTQPLLPSRRIMDGVIDGVNSGGNCSGIPTPTGFLFFDRRFIGKPLIFVGTIGLIPTKTKGRLSHKKKAQPGDYIVMIGGRVGIDGIHGATFSSQALTSGSPATAVQIGDPITQKKLGDALIREARDGGLYHSITDNGAGGLSCSVAEMAKESGGCRVQLEKVPLKYPGLAPWQIWISESQERMTLAVPPKKWKAFEKLMNQRGVEATVIGTFTKEKRCTVVYHGKKIMDIEMEFLHNGLPKQQLITLPTSTTNTEPIVKQQSDYTTLLKTMLSRLNITSFSFISAQYDHEVQATSVLKPLQGNGRVSSETTAIRPRLDGPKTALLSCGLYPTYSDIDTYHMAACSIDTAIRNIVAGGADPAYIALLDNFCWCDSRNPQRLRQLTQAAQACFEYAVSYGTPFIAGKDSMFNDFKGYDKNGKPVTISIPPTLLITSLGIVPDHTKVVSLDFKIPGDMIYILGETHDEMGGSEYYASLGHTGSSIPHVNATVNKKLYQTFYTAVKNNLIASSISVTRGGLAVALAKSAIGGCLGIDVSLKDVPGTTTRNSNALFAESQGRILVSINPNNKRKFESLMKGNSCAHIGKVRKDGKFVIRGIAQKELIKTDIAELQKAYTKTFKNY